MEKVLSFVWFPIFPAHFGGQKGIADFYKALSHHLSIDCLCASANERLQQENLEVIPELPNHKGQFFQPSVWRKIVRHFHQKRYTYVLIEFPYFGGVGYLLKKRGAIFLLHLHNIESQRFRQLGKWWWPLLSLYEKWTIRQADLVLFKTEQDKAFAVQHFRMSAGKGYVVPYGITTTETPDKKSCRELLEKTYCISPDELILLFAGTLDYLPNAEAVTAIFHQIVPLLDQKSLRYKIIISGRNKDPEFAYLKKYRHPKVVQAGFVKDIAALYGGADAFINPVQKAFGVQTKIVDAIASGLNVVAFEKAGAGLPLYLLNEKLFLTKRNDYDQFVLHILEAVALPKQTPARFYEEFHWQTIAAKFADRLKSIRS